MQQIKDIIDNIKDINQYEIITVVVLFKIHFSVTKIDMLLQDNSQAHIILW